MAGSDIAQPPLCADALATATHQLLRDQPTRDLLTDAYQSYLATHADVPGGSLLSQSAAIAPLRMAFADHVALEPGALVVDLGCGFGPVALELAHRSAVSVVGFDRDAEVLRVARSITGSLGNWLQPGARVELAQGDLYHLPMAERRADAVTASLVFQHLKDPLAAIVEARRVLRPGGRLFVFDVDDGLGASYPGDDDISRLERAFARWQRGRGGDREIGRKLPVLMSEGGFRVTAVSVVPSAALVLTAPETHQRILTAARLAAARTAMIGAEILTPHEFDASLEGYQRAPARMVSRFEARVVVVGSRG